MARQGARTRGIAASARRNGAAICGILLLSGAAAAQSGDPATGVANATAQSLSLLARPVAPRQQLDLESALLGADGSTPRPRQVRLRLAPLLMQVAAAMGRHGLPLRAVRERGRAIAVSASVHVGDHLPELKLHVGDRSPESMGAFYASHKGVRWAVVWPVERFTLRVEGGKDSEFGYMAIAGLHWAHPDKPIALGIGVPARMRGTDGGFGAIAQLRVKFH